jgi:TolB-like protein/Tfp pilus assembly protein PilF
MSDDPGQEYFADGIAEDVITALSRFRSLFVIARNSSFTYKGGAVDITRVARELGVRYVVEGSVRKAGNRVRITAQLIDATSGNHLWADRYDRDLEDIFALQDEITREIVTALEVKLSEGEQVRLWRKRAGNVEAYELFQRGREDHLLFTKEANAQGRQQLERALKINPEFADAKAYLAFTHASAARYRWSQSRESSWGTALDLAKQAVAIDEQSGLAHSTLGWAQLFHREYEAALESTERAVTLNPNGADEYHLLAMVYCYSGRPEEAIDAAKQALRLNPLNPTNSLVELGRAYCQTGRYEDAIGPLTEVVARRPYWLSARLLLALAYYQISRENEASALVREILRSRPNFSINAEAETHPYKNSEDLKRYIDGLRQAGLPE